MLRGYTGTCIHVSSLEIGNPSKVDGVSVEVGFAGLFFSSFFGGHEREYASPRACVVSGSMKSR